MLLVEMRQLLKRVVGDIDAPSDSGLHLEGPVRSLAEEKLTNEDHCKLLVSNKSIQEVFSLPLL